MKLNLILTYAIFFGLPLFLFGFSSNCSTMSVNTSTDLTFLGLPFRAFFVAPPSINFLTSKYPLVPFFGIFHLGCVLFHSLSALSSELVIVDLNEAVQGKDELEYLKNAKAYVDDLIKQFNKKKFLLLVSTKEESEYIGVDKSNSFAVSPSVKLFNQILGDISNNPVKTNDMEKARLELIKNTESDKLNIFDSFEDLYNVIKRVYKLQSSF